MADGETDALIEGNKEHQQASSSCGIGLAVVIVIGFGVGVAVVGGGQWDKACDQPLQVFLLATGITSILIALVQLGLHMNDDGSDSEGGAVCTKFLLLVLTAFACAGMSFFTRTNNCSVDSAISYKWTQGGLLVLASVFSLLVVTVIGIFGGPVFAALGNLFSSVFAWLAGLFMGLSAALSDPGGADNKPPNRTTAEEFALVVNHGVFLWFFLYIVAEAAKESHLPCDRALRTFLIVFGVYGSFMAISDYLYEKIVGMQRRAVLRAYMPYLWGLNLIMWLVWGIFGASETFGSKTCTNTAKETYKLSLLLTILFLFTVSLIAIALLIALLDYLCSGKMRVIMVVEAEIKTK